MIKIAYTTQLFYSKYNTRVLLSIKSNISPRHEYPYNYRKPKESLDNLKWCKENLNSFKIRDMYMGYRDTEYTWKQIIYINEEDKDKVLSKFDNIIEVTQPYDKEHKETLDVKQIIVVRKTLIYKKYKHTIYFKYDRHNELIPWIKKYFEDEDDNTYEIFDYIYSPKINLINDEHLDLIKLTWSNMIRCIRTIRLI